jgi:LacI family transcriptional regulator
MPSRRVALLVEAVSAYGRGVLAGIAEYARAHGPWAFSFRLDDPWRVASIVRKCGCTGAIAAVHTRAQLEQLRSLNLPFVNVSHSLRDAPTPIVTYDDHAVGQMAAAHLLEAGLTRFAYVGGADRHVCRVRGEGFASRIDGDRHQLETFLVEESSDQHCAAFDRLSEWLGRLPRPVGVFACDDQFGRMVLEAAENTGIPVPEELAVVGVDDDPLTSELTHPPLSSVKVPGVNVGHKAAEMLERMMSGGAPPTDRVLLKPISVAARPSSDALTLDDVEVVKAVRFIRENAGRPLQVGDVLESVALSRRSLERRFRQHLGRSPQQEIQRVRVERARSLLAETDMPISEVASHTGFRNADRMAAVFRNVTGYTPSAYRTQYRRR